MPDKVRYFLWLRDGKVVCFNLCMAHNDAVVSEYIGFDYNVAFDLHLYYIAVRDVMKWALANRYQLVLLDGAELRAEVPPET